MQTYCATITSWQNACVIYQNNFVHWIFDNNYMSLQPSLSSISKINRKKIKELCIQKIYIFKNNEVIYPCASFSYNYK